LEKAKVVLQTNNVYKITSDLETKLLDEMNNFDVELFTKKRFLINYLKELKFFTRCLHWLMGQTPSNSMSNRIRMMS
jgi:hypothetical protein